MIILYAYVCAYLLVYVTLAAHVPVRIVADDIVQMSFEHPDRLLSGK